MSEKNNFGSSPYNRDELPTYKEAISGDETRIPMAQAYPADEFIIKTNKSGSAYTVDHDTCAMNYLWGSALTLVYVGLGLLLFGHFGGDIPLTFAALICGWVCFVVGYFGYLFIALRLHWVNKVLEQLVEKSEFVRYTENLKQAAPRITWRLVSFHEETRVINLSGRTTYLKAKIPTWTGEQTFPYKRWEHLSTMFEDADSDGYRAVTVSVECALSDGETEAVYEQTKNDFVNPNKDKDVKYELEEVVDVEGLTFKDKMLVKMSSSVFFSRRAYVIATLFLLAPIWHCKIGGFEAQNELRVIKKISV